MKRVLLVLLAMVLVVSMAAFSACKAEEEPPVVEEVLEWRFQSIMPPAALAHKLFYPTFIRLIEEKSGGRIKVTLYPPDAIVPKASIVDGTGEGVVELGSTCGTYETGVMPEGLPEWGLPYGLRSWDQMKELFFEYENGRFLKLIQEAYAERGVHYLTNSHSGSCCLMTTFPVNTAEDLQGKKIRSVGIVGQILDALGVALVPLSPTELFVALQRGTVDGVFFVTYCIDSYKLNEVVNYVVWPSLQPSSGCNLFINLALWNKLPSDLKAVVEEAAIEAAEIYSLATISMEEEAIKVSKEKGVKFAPMSEELTLKMKELAWQYWLEWGERSPRTNELIEIMTAYLKEKGLW